MGSLAAVIRATQRVLVLHRGQIDIPQHALTCARPASASDVGAPARGASGTLRRRLGLLAP